MDIAQVDRNFSVESSVNIPGLQFYDVLQEQFSIHGLRHEDGAFCPSQRFGLCLHGKGRWRCFGKAIIIT